MRNNKYQDVNGGRAKRRAARGEVDDKREARPEGSVAEHRSRIHRHQSSDDPKEVKRE